MTYINPNTTEELDLLFQFVPPEQLKSRITHIYFHYLTHAPPKDLPDDFQKISEDIYFLIQFLEKIKTHDTEL